MGIMGGSSGSVKEALGKRSMERRDSQSRSADAVVGALPGTIPLIPALNDPPDPPKN